MPLPRHWLQVATGRRVRLIDCCEMVLLGCRPVSGEGWLWTVHTAPIPGSGQTWMAYLGPDTPAMGEREMISPVTENQMAATLAPLLGEDYNTAVPNAGLPIGDVFEVQSEVAQVRTTLHGQ